MTSKRKPKDRQKPKRARRTLRNSTLTASQKVIYQRCLALLSDLRGGKGSYSQLLRKYRLSGRTARKYLGGNLLGGIRGTPVRASRADRLLREMLFPTASGDVPVRIRGSRAATKLSEYFQDRDRLLRGKIGPDEFEAKWRDVRIAGQEVFADTSAIFQIANAGELKVEHLYASTGGAE